MGNIFKTSMFPSYKTQSLAEQTSDALSTPHNKSPHLRNARRNAITNGNVPFRDIFVGQSQKSLVPSLN